MSNPELQKNYYQLFNLPEQFTLDERLLGERFRQLQQQLHPDRYASASDHEQRIAVQYSALVNQAYTTLRQPLLRAVYLLELRGMTQGEVAAQKVAGGFLMEQLELREKLESIGDMVDPETVLDHLMAEIVEDIKIHREEFAQAYTVGDLEDAAAACVKMQYLEKLMREAEQIESAWLD
jgi:molecular chaperone HscB